MFVHKDTRKPVRIVEQGNDTTYVDADGDKNTIATHHFNTLYEEATGKELDAAIAAFTRKAKDTK